MNQPAKQEDIIQWHIDNNHTITYISKTRLSQQQARFLKHKHLHTTFIHTSNSTDVNGSGAAIIINQNLTSHLHSIHEVPGRCITIQLKFKHKTSVTVSGIYGKANWDKRITCTITQHLQQQHQHSTHSIIAGDFNEHHNHPKGLLKWLHSNHLVNCARLYNKENEPIWTNGHSKTTIDFIWLSPNLA